MQDFYSKCTSFKSPTKIQQWGNISGQSLANYFKRLTNHVWPIIVGSVLHWQTPARQPTAFLIHLYAIPTWMWMKIVWIQATCIAGLPVFLTASNPTPAPPWRVWALSMQLPGHDRAVIQWARMNLDCVANAPKQLRSPPIFVKSPNSSTIIQYTDINR